MSVTTASQPTDLKEDSNSQARRKVRWLIVFLGIELLLLLVFALGSNYLYERSGLVPNSAIPPRPGAFGLSVICFVAIWTCYLVLMTPVALCRSGVDRIEDSAPKRRIGRCWKYLYRRSSPCCVAFVLCAFDSELLLIFLVIFVVLEIWSRVKRSRKPILLPGVEAFPSPPLTRLTGVSGFIGRFCASPWQIMVHMKPIPAACMVSRGQVGQICFSQSLLSLVDERELLAVTAHELGHHFAKLTLLKRFLLIYGNLVVLAAPVFLVSRVMEIQPDDPLSVLRVVLVSMPCLWLAGCLWHSFIFWLCRGEERRANQWALENTGDPAAFISAMTKVAQLNKSTGRSCLLDKLLLATHPSLDEVCEQARRFARDKGIDLNAT